MEKTNGKLDITRQYAFAEEIARLRLNKKYCVVTMGCQMNVRDSETLCGWLSLMGFTEVKAREDADIIIYNTCCVRENAENKALGNVIWLKELKKDKPDLIIGVCGCMMQEKGLAEELKRKYPFIDLVFGTHNAANFPEYLSRVLLGGERVFEVWDSQGSVTEGQPALRSCRFSAFVNIMYGCNNFCTYCIVPYVRGRERSRQPEDILDECAKLKDAGVKEITLLGQNVNSYMGGGSAFAELLKRVDKLGIERVRFMTSHPKDITDELISCFGSLKHLCPQLHLPMQAGDDEVLKRMNRRYTIEAYMDKVRRVREVCPEIGLTTDIIAGFPGETRAQFEGTLKAVEQARFDSAYTFIYSPREGTAAAKYPDPVSIQEKTEWLEELIALQLGITADMLKRQTGKTFPVLVESVSLRSESTVGGKTPRGLMVNFPGGRDLIGRIVDVRITGAGKNTLKGELEE